MSYGLVSYEQLYKYVNASHLELAGRWNLCLNTVDQNLICPTALLWVTMYVKSTYECAKCICIFIYIYITASHHDHAVWWNWCLNKVDQNPICSATMLQVSMSLYIYIYIYIINLFWAWNSIKLRFRHSWAQYDLSRSNVVGNHVPKE